MSYSWMSFFVPVCSNIIYTPQTILCHPRILKLCFLLTNHNVIYGPSTYPYGSHTTFFLLLSHWIPLFPLPGFSVAAKLQFIQLFVLGITFAMLLQRPINQRTLPIPNVPSILRPAIGIKKDLLNLCGFRDGWWDKCTRCRFCYRWDG